MNAIEIEIKITLKNKNKIFNECYFFIKNKIFLG